MKGFFFSITSPPSFLLLDISLPTYRDPVNLTFSDHLSLESRGGDRDNNDWKKSEWSAKLGSISPSYMNLWSKEEISSIATQTQHDSSSNGDRNCYSFPINNALATLSSSASFSGHRIDNDYADDMDNYFRLALIVSGYIANRIREGREMLTCEEALLDHCPQSPLSLFLLFFLLSQKQNSFVLLQRHTLWQKSNCLSKNALKIFKHLNFQNLPNCLVFFLPLLVHRAWKLENFFASEISSNSNFAHFHWIFGWNRDIWYIVNGIYCWP